MTSAQASSAPTVERGIAWLGRIQPVRLVQLLAIVPILSTVDLVQASSQLQWFDYWTGLARFTEADGSLRPLDLFFYANSHVPAIPSLISWINVQLTGGLAHALGYYDIAVVIAQLLLLRWLLPRERLGAWTFSLLVVAFAVLLFAPQGAWNFSRAASGTAWLTANLLALIAIVLAARGRLLWAILFAGLASITYGTGLMAWPAVVLVTALKRAWGWRSWALVASGVVTLTVYALQRPPGGSSTVSSDLNDIARRTLQTVGSVINPNPDVALIAGAAGIGIAGFLAVSCWQRLELRDDAVPWVALATYAILAALLIGLVRGGYHDENLGVTSRYASLSILLWIAVLALGALRFQRDVRAWPLGFVVVALAFASGQPTLDGMRRAGLPQDELAIALRMNVSTGYPYAPRPEDVALFKSMGHYPFSSDFAGDCGLLGRRIERDSIVPPSTTSTGNLDRFDVAYNAESVRLAGWYASIGGDTRCVVFTDASLRVIGAAAYGYERPDLRAVTPTGEIDLGFYGVARSGAAEYRAFAVLDGHDGLYEVPGALSEPDRESSSG
jgi:hypothetical protein